MMISRKQLKAGVVTVGAVPSLLVGGDALAAETPVAPARSGAVDPAGRQVPVDRAGQLIDALNDEYEKRPAPAAKGTRSQRERRPFTADNTDVHELDPAKAIVPPGMPASVRRPGERITAVVPAGTVVNEDGTTRPAPKPKNFAMQEGGDWGDLEGYWHGCFRHEAGSPDFYAQICTTWTWDKLQETDWGTAYWNIHTRSSLTNRGHELIPGTVQRIDPDSNALTKQAFHAFQFNSTTSAPLDWAPKRTTEDGCTDVDISLVGGNGSVGMEAQFPVARHCEKTWGMRQGEPMLPGNWVGASYEAPSDGIKDQRELVSANLYAVSGVEGEWDIRNSLVLYHGVQVGCFKDLIDQVLGGCAL